ncbi:MAG: GNAT family N-acetyltransferase [Rubricoccaceae bacterium]
MHLRPLTRADEPLLWEMLVHALHVPPGTDPFPPEMVRQPKLARYVTGWMTRPGDLGVAVELAGEAVGATWVRLWRADEPGFGFVNEVTPELSMAVHPGYRGRGLGTALLHRMLEDARDHFEAMSLSVSATNPAQHLYQRLGFTVITSSRDGSLTMGKPLTDVA